MILSKLRSEREVELICSVLNAWKTQVSRRMPWHITEEGWRYYLAHPNPKVRAATLRNPYRKREK